MSKDEPTAQPVALLPCPFCGGSARLITRHGSSVQCNNDQCIIGDPAPFNDFTHRSDAVEAWNRRATPAATAQPVAQPDATIDAVARALYLHGAPGHEITWQHECGEMLEHYRSLARAGLAAIDAGAIRSAVLGEAAAAIRGAAKVNVRLPSHLQHLADDGRYADIREVYARAVEALLDQQQGEAQAR